MGAATRPDPSGRRNGLPERKPYVYRGETEEPTAVIAARERWRARDAEIAALGLLRLGEESMPDIGPGPGWYAERAGEDADDLAELDAARERYHAVMDALPAVPPPAPPPVTEAVRCRGCGYLTTAIGHRVKCGE